MLISLFIIPLIGALLIIPFIGELILTSIDELSLIYLNIDIYFSSLMIYLISYLIILFSGLLSCDLFFYMPITSNTELLTLSMSSLLILNSKDHEKPFILDEPKIPENISPSFITGFTDAEASFCIKIIPNTKLKLGYQIYVSFQYTLHSRDQN